MATIPKHQYSVEEYLAFERGSETKHEYFAGEIFAMVGARRPHNLIVGNVLTGLNTQLRDQPCEVYPGDMRVKVSPTRLYTYPDVAVVCDEPQFDDDESDTLLNPRLLVEVLSHSTEAYDRGVKFEHYQTIESLAEYVLIAQDRRHVERHVRQPDGRWLLAQELSQPQDVLALEAIGCRLTLEDIYHKVQLSE